MARLCGWMLLGTWNCFSELMALRNYRWLCKRKDLDTNYQEVKATNMLLKQCAVTYDETVVSLYDALRARLLILSLNNGETMLAVQYPFEQNLLHKRAGAYLCIYYIIWTRVSLAMKNLPLRLSHWTTYLLKEYHQDCLKKNLGGYCHINVDDVYILSPLA